MNEENGNNDEALFGAPSQQADAEAAKAVKRLLERWRTEHREKAKQVEERLAGPDASEVERILASVVAHEAIVSERLADMEAVMLGQLFAFLERTQSESFRHVSELLKSTFVLRTHGARRLKEYSEALSVLATRRNQAGPQRHLKLVG